MQWELHYRWKLYRVTGRKAEGMEQCTSTAGSLKQAKKDTERLMPHQLKTSKWRKIAPDMHRLTKKGAYFRVDLELLGWTPPRWKPKESLNPKIQELRKKRTKIGLIPKITMKEAIKLKESPEEPVYMMHLSWYKRDRGLSLLPSTGIEEGNEDCSHVLLNATIRFGQPGCVAALVLAPNEDAWDTHY